MPHLSAITWLCLVHCQILSVRQYMLMIGVRASFDLQLFQWMWLYHVHIHLLPEDQAQDLC